MHPLKSAETSTYLKIVVLIEGGMMQDGVSLFISNLMYANDENLLVCSQTDLFIGKP